MNEQKERLVEFVTQPSKQLPITFLLIVLSSTILVILPGHLLELSDYVKLLLMVEVI